MSTCPRCELSRKDSDRLCTWCRTEEINILNDAYAYWHGGGGTDEEAQETEGDCKTAQAQAESIRKELLDDYGIDVSQ